MRRSSTEASARCRVKPATSFSLRPRKCELSVLPAAIRRCLLHVPSPYGVARYVNETKRLYGVVEERLKGREFILDSYGIADIKTFGWVRNGHRLGIDIDEFPNVKAWLDRIANRPAVQTGIANSQ